VEAQLVVHFGVHGFSMEQGTETEEQIVEHGETCLASLSLLHEGYNSSL
jgi:hypothetical protein